MERAAIDASLSRPYLFTNTNNLKESCESQVKIDKRDKIYIYKPDVPLTAPSSRLIIAIICKYVNLESSLMSAQIDQGRRHTGTLQYCPRTIKAYVFYRNAYNIFTIEAAIISRFISATH